MCVLMLYVCVLADSGVSEFGRLAAGQSRPILHGDRTNIESQLAHHHQQEQHKARNSRKRQDLLDANPWENSSPHTTPLKPALPHPLSSDSMSTADNFFSLDLHSSVSSSAVSTAGHVGRGMDDSFASTASNLSSPGPLDKGVGLRTRSGATVHRRYLDDYGSDSIIPLHEGVGLQQLSQPSPPMPRPPRPKTPPPSCKTPPLSCKFTVALSGMTVALLEADPSYTYTSCVGEGHSGGVAGEASMDEAGLDTSKYFELVSELLKDGVNRHQLHLHQEQLAQILPADHLMSVGHVSTCIHMSVHACTCMYVGCGCL